jgi:uncharacterized protein YegL
MAKRKRVEKTLVAFLLDRSGSMSACRDATIEAFNGYLSTLQDRALGENDIEFTFLQFDDQSLDKIYGGAPIGEVRPLNRETFVPRGGTPLIDAAYEMIRSVERLVIEAPGNPKVVICIQTDGQENSSRKYTWFSLNELISAKRALGWQFNFMGVGLDAYRQSQAMGIGLQSTMSYNIHDRDNTMAAFRAVGMNTASFASGAVATTGYTAAQRLDSGDQIGIGLGLGVPAASLVPDKPAKPARRRKTAAV